MSFRLKCNSAVSKLGREVDDDTYSTEIVQTEYPVKVWNSQDNVRDRDCAKVIFGTGPP